MRLWHKSLIEILPRQQLLGQWRECCLIAKGLHDGNLNHILVNRVKDYPLEHFHYYSGMISDEMERRKYKCNYFTFDRWLHFEKNHCRYNELFDGWHNDRYLRQCLYNLQEKYDAKGIPQDEWCRIVERFGDKFDL